jgi:hypothetical protein
MKSILTLITALLLIGSAQAGKVKIKKWYLSGSQDQFVFALRPSNNAAISPTVRFSYLLNGGTHFNYNFNNNIGFFTGLEGRNVGERYCNTAGANTIVGKGVVYTSGIPVGIQFGNLMAHKSVSLGGGIDMVTFGKSKSWIDGDKKNTKVKKWDFFPNNTNRFVPFLFVSAQYSKIGFKFQTYLSSFYKGDTNPNHLSYISLFFDLKPSFKLGDAAPKNNILNM